jgi:hypothetical protein
MDEISYKELAQALNGVSDITTRIDERVKILVEDNNVFKTRFERVAEIQSALVSRLSIIESNHDVANVKNDIVSLQEKIEFLSSKFIKIEQDMCVMGKTLNNNEYRWANIVDFLYKLSTIVIGAIILWKLGIKS